MWSCEHAHALRERLPELPERKQPIRERVNPVARMKADPRGMIQEIRRRKNVLGERDLPVRECVNVVIRTRAGTRGTDSGASRTETVDPRAREAGRADES